MLPHHKKVIDAALYAYPHHGQRATTTKRSSSEVQHASATPDYVIAVFALLLALAIAAWSLRLGKRQSIQGLHVHTQNLEAPDTDALDVGVLNVAAIINTDTLPHLPAILPLPAAPGTGTAGSRPAGLLSRYGAPQQERQ
jgi:hypothetical protein